MLPHSTERALEDDNTRCNQEMTPKRHNVSDNDDDRHHEEFRTYPAAWWALGILLLLRIATSVFQFTYSVIPHLAADTFQVSLTAVNWLANIQGFVYVFISFFTGWIYERLGVKKSLLIAAMFCTVGACLRIIAIKLSPPSFGLTMFGQIVGAVASPLALNVMSLFASTWFTEKLRATAGMFVASNYGAILVMFMVPSITKTEEDIPMTLYTVGIIATCALISLLFMPTAPPHPPSHVSHQSRPSFREGIKILSRNYSFWIVFLIQGVNVGISIAFGTIFTQIVSPFEYTDIQAGQINAISFFAGTFGSAIAGVILDATKQHRLLLRSAPPLIFFSNLGFYLLMKKDSYLMILYLMVMNQFFVSFLVPVAMETGCETAYPVSEATSSSILWQGAQIFGFIILAMMDVLRDPTGDPPNNMQHALLLVTILTGIMAALAFAFQGRMCRSEAIALEIAELEKEQLRHEQEQQQQQVSTALKKESQSHLWVSKKDKMLMVQTTNSSSSLSSSSPSSSSSVAGFSSPIVIRSPTDFITSHILPLSAPRDNTRPVSAWVHRPSAANLTGDHQAQAASGRNNLTPPLPRSTSSQ